MGDIKEKFKSVFAEIVDSGKYTDSSLYGGKYVQLFEKELRQYLLKDTVVVDSGTSALIISLKLAGVKCGDEVIIPAYGFIATKNAVLALQAKPVYVDIDHDTFCMSMDDFWDRHYEKAKAVILVDLYGNICEKPVYWGRTPIIEDACQAFNTIKEIRSHFTAFSFYPTKQINTMEGGAIACKRPAEVRLQRTYPNGLNYRMPEINAAMGYLQMLEFEPKEIPKKHYNYTLSPEGDCPIADKVASNPW